MNLWPVAKVSDVCELIVDCVNKTAPLAAVPTRFKMIRTTNVRNGFIDTENVRYVDESTFRKWTRRALPLPGDVVLTREAPLGEVGIIRNRDSVFLGQRTIMYRADRSRLEPYFLMYSMLSEYVQGQIRSYGSGSTVEHMRLPDCFNLLLSLPPLETQRKIAAVLSTYDDLIGNNSRRIKLLDEMAQGIYQEWFVDFRYPGHEGVALVDSELGRIPEGWSPRAIGNICSLMQAGGTPSRDNPEYWANGSVDWFTTTELRDGFLMGSTEHVTDLAVSERKTRIFAPGTILMAIYGSPTVGRLGILTTEGACNQAALAMVGRNVPQALLYYMLAELRQHFNAIAQGAAQQNISKQKVEQTLVALPTEELCRAADTIINPLWEQRKILELANSRLRMTRDHLLPRLISGEIDLSGLDIDTARLVA